MCVLQWTSGFLNSLYKTVINANGNKKEFRVSSAMGLQGWDTKQMFVLMFFLIKTRPFRDITLRVQVQEAKLPTTPIFLESSKVEYRNENDNSVFSL